MRLVALMRLMQKLSGARTTGEPCESQAPSTAFTPMDIKNASAELDEMAKRSRVQIERGRRSNDAIRGFVEQMRRGR